MIREGEFAFAGDDIGAQLHLADPSALFPRFCQSKGVGEQEHEERNEQGHDI